MFDNAPSNRATGPFLPAFFRTRESNIPTPDTSHPGAGNIDPETTGAAARSRKRTTPFDRIRQTPRPRHSKKHRTLFLSDIHLGTPGCKADLLLDFLRHNDAETIFLVGDIIDGWRIKRSWFWHESHNAVVQEILHKVRHGTRVVYVPGNHDEALRDYTGLDFAGIDVCDEIIHRTADGREMLSYTAISLTVLYAMQPGWPISGTAPTASPSPSTIGCTSRDAPLGYLIGPCHPT